jgi:hypothetical protein
MVLVAQRTARGVDKDDLNQAGFGAEYVYAGADQTGLAAGGIHVEGVLTVRVPWVDTIEVVR